MAERLGPESRVHKAANTVSLITKPVREEPEEKPVIAREKPVKTEQVQTPPAEKKKKSDINAGTVKVTWFVTPETAEAFKMMSFEQNRGISEVLRDFFEENMDPEILKKARKRLAAKR